MNRRYEAAFGVGGVFNQGTVPFYWREYEPEPGVIRAYDGEETTEEYWNSLSREKAVEKRFWRRPPPGRIIDMLKSKDLRVHGHILVTGGLRPDWLYGVYCPEEEKRFLENMGLAQKDMQRHDQGMGIFSGFARFCDRKLYPRKTESEIAAALPIWTSTMRRLWTKRVEDIGSLFGGKVDSWDVVNESSRDFAKYGRSRTGLPVWKSYKGIMPGDFPLTALLDAKRSFPATAELPINDNSINENFLKQVNDLTAEGARIDLVGCQMHILKPSLMKALAVGNKRVNWIGTPETIRNRLDMMAKTGRRIHISEVTIPQSGTDDDDLAVQAVAVRNLYRIWFSHKAVAGITWWNLVDGCSFVGEPKISGLFTRDMRPKIAYKVLYALVNGEWKSKGSVLVKDGGIKFRGFRGQYRLTWTGANGKAFSKAIEVK